MDASLQLTAREERDEFDDEVERLLTQLPPLAPSHAYRQILLAYDGSPAARAALERVAAVTTSETTVTVITVIPFESIGASPDPIKPELRDWQWHSLTEAAALLEQRGIKAFIDPPPATQPQSSARSRGHSTPTSSSSAAATTSGGIHHSNDGRSAAGSSERSPAMHSSSLPEPGRSNPSTMKR
jgi:Universal stress protein family